MKWFNFAATAAVLLAGANASAQTPPKSGTERLEQDVLTVHDGKANVVFERQTIGLAGGDRVEFMSAEASIAGKTIKGAPYSAEVVNERSQTLADGNRIVDKSTSVTYRDGEGRTRRELVLGKEPRLVIINDPVANVSYHLDTKTKTARKLPVAPGLMSFGPGMAVPGQPFQVSIAGPDGTNSKPLAPGVRMESMAIVRMEQSSGPAGLLQMKTPAAKTESLPKQVVEGLEVEGTRTVTTIAAGEIGNERPIEIVHERWYSPELQAIVMTKNLDPRLGDATYKLTNIKRGEPHPSLFQVPSDYTLEEGAAGVRVMRRLEHKVP